jgi:hypothetical protein
MGKRYYLVAYGNMARWSQRVASMTAAAIDTYGVCDTERMTVVDAGGRSPAYLTQRQKAALRIELRRRHLEKTGNDIGL